MRKPWKTRSVTHVSIRAEGTGRLRCPLQGHLAPCSEEDTVTRIPVHTVESAPEGSRDTLKALAARFGKVLNIHGAMAHSPAVLETYAAIQEALQDTGTFDGRT